MNLQSALGLYANRKLHYRTRFQGLPISVENRAGSVRQGKDWKTKMQVPYGYIKGTKGMDGDEVDVFVGPNESAKDAYIITIKKQPEFKDDDEQKVMLGFNTPEEAKKCFHKHYDDPRFFGKLEVKSMSDLRDLVTGKVKKIQANLGEPEISDGQRGHLQPVPTFHPPSLRNPQYVPVDSPVETDDRFLDATKRKEAGTKALRDQGGRKKGFDTKYVGVKTTDVSGFPSGSVGGFG